MSMPTALARSEAALEVRRWAALERSDAALEVRRCVFFAAGGGETRVGGGTAGVLMARRMSPDATGTSKVITLAVSVTVVDIVGVGRC